MFARFTDSAIKVMLLAQEEARRLNWRYVGTEMILLALLSERGKAASVLKEQDISLNAARREVERIRGRGSGFAPTDIPFTTNGKRLLELSWNEATKLGVNHVSPEHLLLAIISLGQGTAIDVLSALDADLQKIRRRLLTKINDVKIEAESVRFEEIQRREEERKERKTHVVEHASEEARRLGHSFVGTEMMLVGLLRASDGIAASALNRMGVTLENARVELERLVGRGKGDFVSAELPFTPRARRALELSWNEARELGHHHIGSDHLLLGLIREGEGGSIRVLRNLGIEPGELRQMVLKLIADRELFDD